MIDPSASDWSDLDLLTVTEARERLVSEIDAMRREIAAAEQAGGANACPDQLESLRRRLAMLQERLGR
jgi:hypothetical protein